MKRFILLSAICYLLSAICLTCDEPPRKSVAVTVFENLGKNEEYDWIGTGFAETLTSKLVYVKSLKVIERSQLKKIIREQKLQMSEIIDRSTAVKICKFLDIEYMITGSYSNPGDELKVSARIINIKTSEEENPVEVSGKFKDLFSLQDELIIKIAGTIDAPVSEKEKIKIARSPADNIFMYEWYAKGMDYYDKNEYGRSMEYYEKALEASKEKEEENEGIKIAVFYGMGNIYAASGKYEKAIECYNNGLKMIKETDDEQLIAGGYNNLGTVFNQKGDAASALEYYNKSLEIYQKIKNRSDIAVTYFNIGCIYKNRNDYDNALIYYNKSMSLAERVGDERLTAELYAALGNIYRNRKDYARAMEYCVESLKVIEKLTGDLQGKSICYASIGDTYRDAGRHKEAVNYYNKSLETIEAGRETKDKNLMALVLYNMAVLYGEQEEYRIALHFALRALDTYREIGDETNIQDTQSVVKQLTEVLEKK